MASIAFEMQDVMPLMTAAAELLRPILASEQIAYTERHAEQLLDLGIGALGAERRSGNIECTFVRNQIRYTREQLLAYLAKHKFAGKVDGAAKNVGFPRLEGNRTPGGKVRRVVRRVANVHRETAARILRAGKAG